MFALNLFQVGCFDPYSDDPRLGIQKISLCKYSGKLVVAGTAGQVRFAVFIIDPNVLLFWFKASALTATF